MAFADTKQGYDYINQFQKNHYDRIVVLRTKGDREKLDALAKDRGVSRNELINWCIDQQLRTLGIDMSK